MESNRGGNGEEEEEEQNLEKRGIGKIKDKLKAEEKEGSGLWN